MQTRNIKHLWHTDLYDIICVVLMPLAPFVQSRCEWCEAENNWSPHTHSPPLRVGSPPTLTNLTCFLTDTKSKNGCLTEDERKDLTTPVRAWLSQD